MLVHTPADTITTSLDKTMVTMAGDMALLFPEVTSSTASSISIKWTWDGMQQANVRGFKVHFRRMASSYVQFSDMLPSDVYSYGIKNLVADTYYTVCVSMFRNDTSNPINKCVDAQTRSWHIPVSIGSSIGAVLALSIIVLIVLASRCPRLIRRQRTAAQESGKYDSMSSHFPDDRCDISDTTIHKDDDIMYSPSDGDSLTDTTIKEQYSSKQSLHQSPQSLADRLCNGTRGAQDSVIRPTTKRVPLAKCGRAMSLQDKKQQHHQRARQARLAHLHANFHSIQSEPGSSQRLHGAEFPASTPVKDLQSSRRASHHSSLPSSCSGFSKPLGIGCSHKPAGYKDAPRLLYRIESATSEPAVTQDASKTTETHYEVSRKRTRKPGLKSLGRTFHMSIDADTIV